MRVLPSHFRAAILAARSHTQGFGVNQLPIDLKSTARQFGVMKIEPRDMRAEGYLGQSGDGELVIRYRRGSSPERVRFTIAHEIAHIILARVQGKDVSDPLFRRDGGTSEEELAVNRIAAELLMPEPLLRNSIQARRPSWSAIWQLRTIFAVSTTALLRRILELPGLPAVFFRIDCSDTMSPLQHRCQTSRQPTVLFGRSIEEEVRLILAAAEKGNRADLQIYFADSTAVIQMASRFMPFYGKPECWSIGWADS